MLKTVGNPSTRYGDQTITDGNLVIGTAGKGIDFSATGQAAGMTSELLADYEEGTWTPAYASTGATFSYTQQVGRYIKVGKLVYAQFRILASASGTVTNALTISGLPYTSNSDAYTNSAVAVGFSTFTTIPTGFVDYGATTIGLNDQTGAVGLTPTNTGMNVGNKYLIGTLMYYSAT